MSGQHSQPLHGLRVVDATHVLAGPFATYQLALLGAQVIRVERIDGDDFVRRHGGTDAMKAAGLGASFLSQNACKRSIAVDLKDERGRQLFHRLATDADIVVENFRPGVVDRLGIGFADIAAINPRVIYCSLSGYGPTGPLAGAPAYDHIVQGLRGMMAMTGTAESGPMRVGFPIVDYIAGQTALAAILAALANRDRNGAKAQHLEVPMLDSLVALMAANAVDYETTGTLRGLHGNEAFSNSPFSDRFDTCDGQIVVTANTPAQAARLCDLIDRRDLIAFAKAGAAIGQAGRDDVAKALREAFRSDTALAWETRLNAASVPAAKVRNLAEVLAHPQLRESGLMRRLEVPETGGSVHVPGIAFRSDSWPPIELEAAPTLSRDADEILTMCGYTETDIQALRSANIVK